MAGGTVMQQLLRNYVFATKLKYGQQEKRGVWSRRVSCRIAILLLSVESLFCLVREMSQGDSWQ